MSSEQDPSVAAEQARQRLHEEIERVRSGVEEMLAEQENGGGAEVRRELEAIRAETRAYVKKRVGKSERRLNRRIEEIDAKTEALERKIEQVEQDRRYAEWRIHTNNEQLLDGLLREVRAIADLFTRAR